eukprot:15343565-Ditylum_brightwellii.AAC.1
MAVYSILRESTFYVKRLLVQEMPFSEARGVKLVHGQPVGRPCRINTRLNSPYTDNGQIALQATGL